MHTRTGNALQHSEGECGWWGSTWTRQPRPKEGAVHNVGGGTHTQLPACTFCFEQASQPWWSWSGQRMVWETTKGRGLECVENEDDSQMRRQLGHTPSPTHSFTHTHTTQHALRSMRKAEVNSSDSITNGFICSRPRSLCRSASEFVNGGITWHVALDKQTEQVKGPDTNESEAVCSTTPTSKHNSNNLTRTYTTHNAQAKRWHVCTNRIQPRWRAANGCRQRERP